MLTKHIFTARRSVVTQLSLRLAPDEWHFVRMTCRSDYIKALHARKHVNMWLTAVQYSQALYILCPASRLPAPSYEPVLPVFSWFEPSLGFRSAGHWLQFLHPGHPTQVTFGSLQRRTKQGGLVRCDRSFQSPVVIEEGRNSLPKEKRISVPWKEELLQMPQDLFQKECDFAVWKCDLLVAGLGSEREQINWN